MVKTIECPRCKYGKLDIEVATGYKIITDGFMRKLPLKKHCKSCDRDIKYLVVHENDYERMLAWVQQKDQ